MPSLSFTPLLRLKLLYANDQWHSSRVFTPLIAGWHCEFRPNTVGLLHALFYGSRYAREAEVAFRAVGMLDRGKDRVLRPHALKLDRCVWHRSAADHEFCAAAGVGCDDVKVHAKKGLQNRRGGAVTAGTIDLGHHHGVTVF